MSMPCAVVVRPGTLTTLQDAGRRGARHLAVGASGALDAPAMRLANRLVGNAEHAAVLETTLDGVALHWSVSATVAVTGAPCIVTVDGVAATRGQPLAVPAGAVVEVGMARAGVRAYLAVGGGFVVPPVLASASYDTLARLGPPPLAVGDVLERALHVPPVPPAGDVPGVDVMAAPWRGGVAEVGLWLGPRHEWVDAASLAALTATDYGVEPASNRIALRLHGRPLTRTETAELPSEGIVNGAVQVPPDGQPIVFLADHPTTGGYPVVGVVDVVGLAVCAQLRPGDTLRFRRRGSWEPR